GRRSVNWNGAPRLSARSFWRACAARLDRRVALDRPPKSGRCAPDACAALGGGFGHARAVRAPKLSAELREHHSAAVLLGVGVAFKIYYVMAWRSGQSDFLQSPLTRAVLFSALMTATAFGSVSFSNHPGMGKLLALSLFACTLASAALFQPAL